MNAILKDPAVTNIQARKARLTELKGHIADRVRVNEREAEEAGVCRHGTYVGGIGVDWMCHPCEMGSTIEDEVDTHIDSILKDARDIRGVLHIHKERERRLGSRNKWSAMMLNAIIKMTEQAQDRAHAKQVWDILNDTDFFEEV